MPHKALTVEAMRNAQPSRVIGNCQILETIRYRSLCHHAETIVAVRRIRMHMQVTAQVPAFDERGQTALARCINFTVILPQLGRYPAQAD
ncbi:hypothetical protein WT81_27910 [Burkholderia stagnalis]|nr:hypothetical protein WT81_27910 [Burkholderia stagnalis]KWK53084.1 hypothetical protein WT80_08330 [Burkholderia stagnalis]